MKLGLKIILPILLLLVIVTGAFGFIFYNLKHQETIISIEGAKIRALNGLNERLTRQQSQTSYYVLAYRFNQDRASLLAIAQAELDKSKTLDEMYPFITAVRGRELINSYIDSRKTIESLRNDLIGAIDIGDKEQIDLSYNKWNIQTQNINAALADIGAYNINSLEKTLATVGDIRNKISGIIIILVFVVVATVLFLFFYLRIVITTPIIKLAEFADEISRQNFTTTTTTTTTTRKDELGVLSRAFNTMVVKLKESYTTLEQKVVERTAKLAEKTRESENAQAAALNVLEDLKVGEQKLIEAKSKDEALLASIGDGVIATDQDGKVIVMNKVVTDILGFTGIDLMGKSFVHEVSQEDAQGNKIPDMEQPITLALGSGKTTTASMYQFVHKDGSKVPVAITVTPVIIDSKTIGSILIFRDITKEKDIDRAKSEFVSLASHQLRTPPTGMKWFLEMLLSGEVGQLNEKQKEYFGEVYKNNQRMITLVNALLNVSRIELGMFAIEQEPTDVVALTKGIIEEFNPQIHEKGLRVGEKYSKNLQMIFVDPKLIRIAIQNIISNAVKYTPLKGTIDVEIFLKQSGESIGGRTIKKDSLIVVVSDTGYGIPKDQQDKIFTKLFRADNVREKDTDGTGLGLYLAKSIIDHAQGDIWFESELNKGTIFYIAIPLEGMKKREGITKLTIGSSG